MCHVCTHVFNATFDDSVDQYTAEGCTMYNRGALWQTHVDRMAQIVNSIGGEVLLEIGAGNGDFLDLINVRRKIAYEPSRPDVDVLRKKDITVYPRYFNPEIDPVPLGGTTLVMRHVLEHIVEPRKFLTALVQRCYKDTRLFIEVPNIENALLQRRIEDWTYEHPNHFTAASLRVLFAMSGWYASVVGRSYGDEVLYAVVQPEFSEADKYVREFAGLREKLHIVRDVLSDVARTGRTVFWGATGKGINTIYELVSVASAVVDSDERKVGRFVPGLNIPIESPSVIRDDDIVLITTNWRADDIICEMKAKNIKPAAVFSIKNGALCKHEV